MRRKTLIWILLLAAPLCRAQNFQSVAERALGPDTHGGWATAWGDYDNDDYPDLFIVGRPNQLFRNNGNGTFSAIPVPHLTTENINQNSALWTDVNNDGFLDLLVSHLGPGTPIPRGSPLAPRPNFLYINRGPPDFRLEVASDGDLGVEFNMTWTSAFVDFDQDADLDMVAWGDQGDRDLYFENDGKGTFFSVEGPTFLVSGDFSAGGQFVDVDGDGDLDLLVTNFMSTNNELYVNRQLATGEVRFEPLPRNLLSQDEASDLVPSWGDTDGDGDLDVFVPVWDGLNDRFFINDGNLTFARVTVGDHVNQGGFSLGNSFVDVDNDGDLDLYVTDQRTTDKLYENQEGAFRLATEDQAGDILRATSAGSNSSVSAADYDLDGDMDLVIATSGAPHVLLRNDLPPGNSWIHVDLVGTASNRLGVGARVRVLPSDGEWITRVLHGGPTGDRGQNHHRLHFGLGLAAAVDSVLVEWPSGILDALHDIAPNQILRIEEGAHPLGIN